MTSSDRSMALLAASGHEKPLMVMEPTFSGRGTVELPHTGPWCVYSGSCAVVARGPDAARATNNSTVNLVGRDKKINPKDSN